MTQEIQTVGELTLTTKEKRAYKAKHSPKVSEIMETNKGFEDLKKFLTQQLIASSLSTGINISSNPQALRTTISLMIRVIETHEWVTLAELKETILSGLVGDLTDYITLTPNNLNKWLGAYRNSPERMAAVGAIAEQTVKPLKPREDWEFYEKDLNYFWGAVQALSTMSVSKSQLEEAAFFGLNKISHITHIREAMRVHGLFEASEDVLQKYTAKFYAEEASQEHPLGVDRLLAANGKETTYQEYQRKKYVSAKALAPYACFLATDIPAAQKTLLFLHQKWIQPLK